MTEARNVPVHVTARHIPALDGVRGLAILVVLIHNASWILGPTDRASLKLLGIVTTSGWVGVQLFFVLSGFLITGILTDTAGSEGYFRSFYIRRFLRIFPLYYAFLALVLFVVPLVADPGWVAQAHHDQVWYWFYLSNWSGTFGRDIPGLPHFWSLAVEEQFYLLWPLLVYLLDRTAMIRVCIAVVLSGPLVRLGLHELGLPTSAAYAFTVARWDALAGGGLIALLAVEDSGRQWLKSRMPYVGWVGLVALGIFGLFDHAFHEDDLRVQVWGQSITVLLFTWLVYSAAAPSSRTQSTLSRGLEAGWLRFLGKYSYAIYVVHFPIHYVASHYLADAVNGSDTLWRFARWAAYVMGVASVSIVLALASWHLLEKRFLDLKRVLAPRPTAGKGGA